MKIGQLRGSSLMLCIVMKRDSDVNVYFIHSQSEIKHIHFYVCFSLLNLSCWKRTREFLIFDYFLFSQVLTRDYIYFVVVVEMEWNGTDNDFLFRMTNLIILSTLSLWKFCKNLIVNGNYEWTNEWMSEGYRRRLCSAQLFIQ